MKTASVSVRAFRHFLPVIALLVGSWAQAAEYTVDVAHSNVGFNVRHLMISTVNGRFNDFVGEFTFDSEKGVLGNNKFEVKSGSIDTGNAKRDGHLKSADFFNVEKHPLLKVTNSKVKKTAAKKYEWTADLAMNGVTKPVKFDVEYLGSIKDPQGQNRVAFNAKAKIKRSDWGLKYNQVLEAGGVAISDDVGIVLDIEAIEKTTK